MASVKTGLDRLVDEGFARLNGLSVGLLAHQPSVDVRLRHVLPLMAEASVKLQTLLGPEHGVDGAAQDMEVVDETQEARDLTTGARIYSLYGATVDSLHPTQQMLEGLDVVVVDLQDVGARYYTYAATMGYTMRIAAQMGLKVLVLDRPNPLGGRDQDIEGPALHPDYHSFVGDFPMCIRHGLTIGEYAQWVKKIEKLDVELEVLTMEGWKRDMAFEDTGLPWVMPSPNMPTMDTAWIYPGQCLLEGTELSEGRGTTRPFELCGAPYLDGKEWAKLAAPHTGPGFYLRPTTIKPMFQKHGGSSCGGLQIHVTDRWSARSMRLSVALIWAAMQCAPKEFAWREKAYEYVSDRLAIDLLFGSNQQRTMLEAGATVDEIMASFVEPENEFREARRDSLIY